MNKTSTLKRLPVSGILSERTASNFLHLKDPFSSLSHLIFSAMCVVGGVFLIVRAFLLSGWLNGLSMILFVLGLVGLYTASGVYHGLDISETVNKRLRQIDHSMIYILIAGTYSPVCLVTLHNTKGMILFVVIWALALIGIFQALFWISCPKWFSSMIYILMGWICVFAMKDIVAALPAPAFRWLLAGGIIYTVGGVIYALKLPLFSHMPKWFGNHELFHLFCIGGSFCHYIMMLVYVASA